MDIETIFQSILLFWSAVQNSTAFSVLLFFLAVYCIILFLNIIMLLILRGVGDDIRKSVFGASAMPAAHKKTIAREWHLVKKYLAGTDPVKWNIAVLEADRITERVLEISGYTGSNFRERLDTVNDEHISLKSSLLSAHTIRNTIIRDRNKQLSREEAQSAINTYETFLKQWDAI